MMAFDLQTWIEDKKKGATPIVEFEGGVSSEKITEFIDKSEAALDKLEVDKKIRKRILFVIIESLQNLYHHSYDKEVLGQESKFGVFLFLKKENMLSIVSGNFLDEQTVLFLKNRIRQLNALTIDEIKDLYKIILNETSLSEKGGGGLGMIDIIRKTKQPIEYDFFDVTKNIAFYEFVLNLPLK